MSTEVVDLLRRGEITLFHGAVTSAAAQKGDFKAVLIERMGFGLSSGRLCDHVEHGAASTADQPEAPRAQAADSRSAGLGGHRQVTLLLGARHAAPDVTLFMWLNVNLGKINLETCWPAVYLVGRPTCPQGLLVTHGLTGPALLHSPIVADQSLASWPLCSPPPSKYVPCFSPLVFQCDGCRGVGRSQGRHGYRLGGSLLHLVALPSPRTFPPAHQLMNFIGRQPARAPLIVSLIPILRVLQCCPLGRQPARAPLIVSLIPILRALQCCPLGRQPARAAEVPDPHGVGQVRGGWGPAGVCRDAPDQSTGAERRGPVPGQARERAQAPAAARHALQDARATRGPGRHDHRAG